MALTLTERRTTVHGDRKVWKGKLTFDSSYPTGGEAVAVSNFGGYFVSHIDELEITSGPDVATKRAVWDAANSKILLYVEDGTSGIEAQAANTSDQSAVDIEIAVYGV